MIGPLKDHAIITPLLWAWLENTKITKCRSTYGIHGLTLKNEVQNIKLSFLAEKDGPEKGQFGGQITTKIFQELGHLLGVPPHAGHHTSHCSTVIVLLIGMRRVDYLPLHPNPQKDEVWGRIIPPNLPPRH